MQINISVGGICILLYVNHQLLLDEGYKVIWMVPWWFAFLFHCFSVYTFSPVVVKLSLDFCFVLF
jgi:hypothetical protein